MKESFFDGKLLDKRPRDPSHHALGTNSNHSVPEEVIGRAAIPIPIGRGGTAVVHCLVVDGDVPFTIGKDTLVRFPALESHRGDWIQIAPPDGRPVRLATSVSKIDNHARIRMTAESIMLNSLEATGIPQPNSSNSESDLPKAGNNASFARPSNARNCQNDTCTYARPSGYM